MTTKNPAEYYYGLLMKIGEALGHEVIPAKIAKLAIERIRLTNDFDMPEIAIPQDKIKLFKKVWETVLIDGPPMPLAMLRGLQAEPAKPNPLDNSRHIDYGFKDRFDHGSPHKFSRVPLRDGSPRMPSAAELIAEADEIGFGEFVKIA